MASDAPAVAESPATVARDVTAIIAGFPDNPVNFRQPPAEVLAALRVKIDYLVRNNALAPAKLAQIVEIVEKIQRDIARRRIDTYYPETGPLRRELYPKHTAYFAAGLHHRERLFLAANRVGKSEGVGAYEATLHLTGQYPKWWTGRRFAKPVHGWCAGKTNETTRDIVQTKLLGPTRMGTGGDEGRKTFEGTGMIPGETIGAVTWKQGLADLADTIKIKHKAGGWSILGLKSYQQGRGSFEGTEQDFIWLDEEPPLDVYAECLIRTMTTDGLILLTFTPLEGMSDVVMNFLEEGQMPNSDTEAEE